MRETEAYKKSFAGRVFLFFVFISCLFPIQTQASYWTQPANSSESMHLAGLNILVNGQPAEAGDEVAVFDSADNLVGLFTLNTSGQYGDLVIMGDSALTGSVDEGAAAGEELTFRFYDASAATEYKEEEIQATIPVNGAGLYSPPESLPLTFTANAFTLVDIKVEEGGTTNTPPSSFSPVYPADGQTGIPSSLTFIWKNASDPDGDQIAYTLYYCDNPDTTSCSPVSVAYSASLKNEALLYASIGGDWMLLLIGSLFAGIPKRRKGAGFRLIVSMLIIVGSITLFSCGIIHKKHDEDNPQEENQPPTIVQPTPGSGETGHSVSGLSSGTTYYWKVVATDSFDGRTESETRSFTTE